MIPLYDDNPTKRIPIVTYTLIAICIAVFVWQNYSLTDSQSTELMFRLGFIPATFFDLTGVNQQILAIRDLPEELTIFSSMFLHGDILHLGGNMLYLWVFGNNVEDSMGRLRYLVFYLLCGVAAALAQGFMEQNSSIPMIGASGAISGVLGGYILLHPRATVFTLIPLGVILTTVRLPAMVVLGLYIVLQVIQAALTQPGEPGVAWWAHVGGFAAGIVLIPFFKSKAVRLFAPPRSRVPAAPPPSSRGRPSS